MNILDILNGHLKEFRNKEEDLMNVRMDICKQCPLFTITKIGPICNNKLWINKDNEISDVEKKDYVKGCACRLDAKTRLPKAKCIINKW